MEASSSGVPPSVLAAFGVGDEVVVLPGGQGTSVYADGLVLKPGADAAHTEWLAGVCSRVHGQGFRLPAPVPTIGGQLVVDGWAAFPFVEGARLGDSERAVAVWLSIVQVSRGLHHALRGEARPARHNGPTHKWAIADEIAWGSRPSDSRPDSEPLLAMLRSYMVDEGLENQLIHGDLSGNVLLSADAAPAVIDFSPYWRPAAYGDAVVIVDALLWWNADPSLLRAARPQDLTFDSWTSLLARAIVFRALATDDLGEQIQDYERVVRLLVGREI